MSERELAVQERKKYLFDRWIKATNAIKSCNLILQSDLVNVSETTLENWEQITTDSLKNIKKLQLETLEFLSEYLDNQTGNSDV